MLTLFINHLRTKFSKLLTDQNCSRFALYVTKIDLSHPQKWLILADAERRRLTHKPVPGKALAM